MSTVIIRQEWAPGRFTKQLAALYLSCSIREVDMYTAAKEITAYGKGRNAYYKKTELDAFIDRMKERNTPN